MKTNKEYEIPNVKMIVVTVEQGFAGSEGGDGNGDIKLEPNPWE